MSEVDVDCMVCIHKINNRTELWFCNIFKESVPDCKRYTVVCDWCGNSTNYSDILDLPTGESGKICKSCFDEYNRAKEETESPRKNIRSIIDWMEGNAKEPDFDEFEDFPYREEFGKIAMSSGVCIKVLKWVLENYHVE